MGNYDIELRNDVTSSMIGRIQEVGERGITSAELADISGVAPVTVRNWLHAYAKEHPELVAPPERSRKGWRWVTDPAKRPKRSNKPMEEAIIDFLKVRGSEGATADEIATALGYSKDTIAHRMPKMAREHIEINAPGRGGNNKPYIWTPVITKEEVSDEIDPNDLDAIQKAFGKKEAFYDEVSGQRFVTDKDKVNEIASGIMQKSLPEFGWKDLAAVMEKEQAAVEEQVSQKNHEGYSDPTAAAAIRNTDTSKTSTSNMAGEVWAIDRQFGGEDYFAILTSSNNHVCGVVLRYENDGHPKPDNAFVYECGGAEWVGNAQRVCTKPIKALKRKVDDLSEVKLARLRDTVRQALDLGDIHSVADEREIARLNEQVAGLQTSERFLRKKAQEFQNKAADLEASEASYANAVDELTAQCDMANKTIESLQKENTGLLAEIERLKSQLADAQSGDHVDEITLHNMEKERAADKATIKAYEFALRCLGGKEVN